MPLYLDRHDLVGATAEDVAMAHLRDLEVQDRYGARYLSYWFDYQRQSAFCLVEAPDAAAASAVHREAHGLVANQILEVDPRHVEAFLGAMPQAPPADPYEESAFRAIMFTDMVDSTAMTQRLGDVQAVRLLRRHDDIVRAALRQCDGSEVKHTGDGIMASFVSVVGAVESALTIQDQLGEHRRQQPDEAIDVRIGLSAGEPVTEGHDLFGSAVQLAARLCASANPDAVLVSREVHDLAGDRRMSFRGPWQLTLRGFAQPVEAYEARWASAT